MSVYALVLTLAFQEVKLSMHVTVAFSVLRI